MKNTRKSFHIPGSSVHYAPEKEFSTQHISVRLSVDFESRELHGICSIRLRPIRGGVRSLRIDACEMQIKRVLFDGKETRYTYDGNVLTIRPAREVSQDDHDLSVQYATSPKRGAYFVHPSEEYPDKPTQVWTQSEADSTRYWLPCHDHPDDKSTSEMEIEVPSGYTAISNGELVSRREVEKGRTIFHWRENAPHSSYLNSFVVGQFDEEHEEVEGIPLYYYFPASRAKDYKRYFGLTPNMLREFNNVTGLRYPFEKYAQVAVHDFIYGGMENITATTLTDTRFPDEKSEEDYAARYSRPDRNHIELVSHELAHTWFGDLVTMRHWSHAWLNEGFATYFEAVYQEREFGVDEFRENMMAKAHVHFDEDGSRYRRSIVDNIYIYSDDIFDTFTYEKASWMLHQLRYILGDELFFGGTRDYLRRYAYRTVDTHDYMRAMEEYSGKALEGYFEQSFFKAGHPEFEVAYEWEEVTSSVRLEVKQTQPLDATTPVFNLPCDMVFYTEKGRQVRRVLIRGTTETFTFELDSEPSIVEFDPEEWLLKKIRFKKSSALLLNQLEHSIDASSRRRAAEEIGTMKYAGAVPKLHAAVLREQHWSVRAEAARALGKVGTPEARNILLELISQRNRRLRRGVVAALGEFKHDIDVQQALKEALFEDESPYIQCEAALSLAKVAGEDAVPSLREAMKLPSPEHGLTEASLEALGSTKGKEVRGILRANLDLGKPVRVRIGALKGYARLGSLDSEDLARLREFLVKDPDYFVKDQLLELVAELGDKRFVDQLARAAEIDTDNRIRRRAMEILTDFLTGPGAESSVKSDIELLRDENRRLGEKLVGMERALRNSYYYYSSSSSAEEGESNVGSAESEPRM